MDKEIHELDKLLNNSESGYAVLLGGAKISDKLNLIEKLLPKVEYLMVGGGMCFTLLKALGHEIGKSLLEESFISKAEELLNSKFGKKIAAGTYHINPIAVSGSAASVDKITYVYKGGPDGMGRS